jgi:hypothetical protein
MPSAQLASIRPSPGYYGKPALRNASANISMRSGVVMFPDARPFTVKLGDNDAKRSLMSSESIIRTQYGIASTLRIGTG